jgi:nucleoside-diphosphate-sugar epimerase/GT2 family glycosyltransferase
MKQDVHQESFEVYQRRRGAPERAESPHPPPRVSVVIVNFNGGALIGETVRALAASRVPVARIAVADNGSSDDSLPLLRAMRAQTPHLHLEQHGRNLGFARAVNATMRWLDDEFVLLLNPDCLVRPEAIATTLAALDADPRAAMAGILIRNPDGSEQAGCRRAIPTPWRAFNRVFHLERVFPGRPRFRSFNLSADPLPAGPTEVEAISGAFMLVRRAAMDEVGMLDEDFFMHCEDLDWCMRFRKAGWKVLFVPGAEAVHYKGTCSANRPLRVEWHKHKGMVRFYRKHFRHQYPAPLMWAVMASVWARFLVVAATGRARANARAAGRRVAFAADALGGERRAPRAATAFAEGVAGRTVLVTGATGFIGRHVVAALAARDAQVVTLARGEARFRGDTHLSVRSGDLLDHASLRGIAAGIDTVLHLAGYAHAESADVGADAEMHWRITVEGTRAMLREARAAGVRRFVFVSSVKAAGEGGPACIDESLANAPTSAYGRAKLAAEELVLAEGRDSDMQVCVLRLPLVYGLDNKGNIPRMAAAIARGRFPPLPETRNRRSMVHVEDVVQALALAATRPEASGKVYYVTDGAVYSTREIYDTIRAALGLPPPRVRVPAWCLRCGARLGDFVQRLTRWRAPLNSDTLEKLLGSAWYSSARIEQELGYRPTRTLADALPEIVASMRGRRADTSSR